MLLRKAITKMQAAIAIIVLVILVADGAACYAVALTPTIKTMRGGDSSVAPPLSGESLSASQIHQETWQRVVEMAKTNAYYRYAIYASRTLAVRHPEVYLMGDALFVEVITSENGYAKAYETKDVHDPYLYGKDMTGGPFSFDQVKFEKYSLKKNVELYPPDYPFLQYLDRRLLPLPSTLKPAHGTITELELAEQYYFSLKKKGCEKLYILYCEDESAYVYAYGKLIGMSDLKERERPSGNPILIFSQESVWYPLMGRDDRAKDSALNALVAKYSTDLQTPNLTELESRLISGLKKVTVLNESRQILMATISAAHTEGTGAGKVVFQPFLAAWRKLGIPTMALGLFQEIYRRANYLSPITAYLAWTLGQHEGEKGLNAMTREYLKYTATPGLSYAHGHTWICMLTGQTIDECYRTQAGHCVWQSASLAAVLDIIGMDNYIIEGCILDAGFTAHTTVYVPKYDLILNNGRIRERGTVLSRGEKGPYSAVRYLSHEGKWANPIIGAYIGTLSPKETAAKLQYLKSLHDDAIRGLVMRYQRYSTIPYEEFVKRLNDEQGGWRPIELPGGQISEESVFTVSTLKERPIVQTTETRIGGEGEGPLGLAIVVVLIAAVVALAILVIRKRAKES